MRRTLLLALTLLACGKPAAPPETPRSAPEPVPEPEPEPAASIAAETPAPAPLPVDEAKPRDCPRTTALTCKPGTVLVTRYPCPGGRMPPVDACAPGPNQSCVPRGRMVAQPKCPKLP